MGERGRLDPKFVMAAARAFAFLLGLNAWVLGFLGVTGTCGRFSSRNFSTAERSLVDRLGLSSTPMDPEVVFILELLLFDR